MGNFFSDLGDSLFGTDAEIKTQTMTDPIKTAVSSPLSAYLASQVGQGIGTYPGEVAPNIDPNYTNRYNEFMKLNSSDLYQKFVADPAMLDWKTNIVPKLEEGYAGGLRSSGRFRSVEDSATLLEKDLNAGRYTASLAYPKAQFEAATNYYNTQANKDAAEYKAWFNSLAQNNPALKSAIDFLNADSGITTFAALDPGKQGSLGDIIKVVGLLGATAMTMGAAAPAAAAALGASSIPAGASTALSAAGWLA